MGKWTELARQITALQIDAAVYLRDYPTDRTSISRLRDGVSATSLGLHMRFIIRPTCDGVLITKTGMYASLSKGTSDQHTERHYRRRNEEYPSGQYPGAFYLGFIHSIFDRRGIDSGVRCSVRSCPYPARDAILCINHIRFFDCKGNRSGKIDMRDVMPSEKARYPLLSSGMLWQDAYNWKGIYTVGQGRTASRRERLNDQWLTDNDICILPTSNATLLTEGNI